MSPRAYPRPATRPAGVLYPHPKSRFETPYHIVRASTRITDAGKHVWDLISDLDHPKLYGGVGGCFMNGREMARQIGLNESTFYRLRQELLRWTLLHAEPVIGLPEPYWFVRLPPGIAWALPADIEGMRFGLSRTDAIRKWEERETRKLDNHIAAIEGLPLDAATPPDRAPAVNEPAPRPVPNGRRTGTVQRLGDLVNDDPAVRAALARAYRESRPGPEELPPPDAPPIDDEELEDSEPGEEPGDPW
jgi:hypothetical protein